jgi:oxygen-independent coproporphyrinogen-3 oxidase
VESSFLISDNQECYSERSTGEPNIGNTKTAFRRNPLDFEIIYNYPPANHTPIVTGDALPCFSKGTPTGIYIHIPFCTNTCSYCHYTRKKLDSFHEADEYVDAVRIEMQKWRRSIDARFGEDIRTIFVGGGTPTILTEKQIIAITDALYKVYQIEDPFRLEEYTWEASPETIIEQNSGKLKILLDVGVNRLSIGVQAFDDRLLAVCERSHSNTQAKKALEEARNKGFSNINIDLIYGLPEQSISDWVESLEETIRQSPESISVHQLRIKSHTPMHERLISAPAQFPSEKTCFRMAALAHVFSGENGYVALENDIFVKHPSKHDHKHQKDKWVRFQNLLGIGAAAYGYLNDISYFNFLTKKDYLQAINSDRLPVWRAKSLSLEEKKARALVLGLTFYEGLSKELYRKNFNEKVEETYGDLLVRLIQDGLIEVNDHYIRLTKKGGFFSPEIRREFYLQEHLKGPGSFGSYFPRFNF